MDKITGMVKICPVCKKDFYVLDVGIWAYKKKNKKGHNKYYCSWKCMRKEKSDEKNTNHYGVTCGDDVDGMP